MFRNKKHYDRKTEHPSGAMADIAFLLLIFFLVTTTILQDNGIMVRLPPYSEEIVPVSNTNVFSIMINAANDLLINGEPANLSDLTERLKIFILNPEQKPYFPESPRRAVVSIKNDRSTLYETYIGVYNEVVRAYNELRNDFSEANFGKPFELLDFDRKMLVRKEIPMIISEAEPTDLAVR